MCPTAAAAAEPGAQRRHRVVREQTRPEQVPDCRDDGVVARRRFPDLDQDPAGALGELPEEQGATADVGEERRGDCTGAHRCDLVSAAGIRAVRRGEIRAPERGEHGPVQRCRHEVRIRLGEQQVRDVRRREGQPPVDARQRPAAGPGDLAGGGQLVEQRRGVAGQAGGQDQRLERARRQRGPGQLLDARPGRRRRPARAASARAGRRG